MKSKITGVMQDKLSIKQKAEEEKSTKNKLIEAGKEEFFEKGYMRASLRQICKKCDVTTGAFYFFFKNKEELLCEIVEPVISKIMFLIKRLNKKEMEDLSTCSDNDRAIMKLELEYRKELLILLEKCEGSCYENFRSQAFDMISDTFEQYFEQYLGHPAKKEVIQMVVNLRIETNINILKGADSMEQALYLNEIMASYAEGGFQNLITNLKNKL